MVSDRSNEGWQAVRIEGCGLQEHMRREWDCLPAWNVYAVYAEPDEWLPYPPRARAAREAEGEAIDPEARRGVFWDRHIDRRYHLDYPLAAKDAPRVRGETLGDPDLEWDTLIDRRDIYLAAAGLTLDSPGLDIVRCIAETYRWESPFYNSKPNGATFGGVHTRQLNNPVEGLLHQCWCIGCSYAQAALIDSCGIPARTIAIGGHHVCEARVDGKWYFLENSCRHRERKGLEPFFPASWHDVTLDPEAWLDYMPDRKAGDYFGANSGEYCLTGGTWRSPMQLTFAADCAFALYPDHERHGIKAHGDGTHQPITVNLDGFHWANEVHGLNRGRVQEMRRSAIPFPAVGEGPRLDFLYHPLRPGDRLRHSFRLDSVDDMQHLEVTIPIAPEPHVAFTTDLGRSLRFMVNDWGGSLLELGAWRPAYEPDYGHVQFTIEVPTEALKPDEVNWIEFRQESALTLQYPFTIAAMEPCIPPLLSDG